LTLDGSWQVWEEDGESLLYHRFLENNGIWRVPLEGGAPRLARRLDGDLEDLYLWGIDITPTGTPLLLFMYEYTGELYALEPPSR
jgi:hypothetical protein